MFRLIHSNNARLSSIKNIINNIDKSIRARACDGFTSLEVAIPTNTVLEIVGRLDYEGYIVEQTVQPRGFTKLVIIWG